MSAVVKADDESSLRPPRVKLSLIKCSSHGTCSCAVTSARSDRLHYRSDGWTHLGDGEPALFRFTLKEHHCHLPLSAQSAPCFGFSRCANTHLARADSPILQIRPYELCHLSFDLFLRLSTRTAGLSDLVSDLRRPCLTRLQGNKDSRRACPKPRLPRPRSCPASSGRRWTIVVLAKPIWFARGV